MNKVKMQTDLGFSANNIVLSFSFMCVNLFLYVEPFNPLFIDNFSYPIFKCYSSSVVILVGVHSYIFLVADLHGITLALQRKQ